VRLIKLKNLDITKILSSNDNELIALLGEKMAEVLGDKEVATDVDVDCICDIISQYSDDVDESYSLSMSNVAGIWGRSKREKFETSVCHIQLYIEEDDYCRPLEPFDILDEMDAAPTKDLDREFGVWVDHDSDCTLIFPRDEDGIIVLPFEDVGEEEHSEGHFTNMISAASDSDSDSSSSGAHSDNSTKPEDRRDSDSSFEIVLSKLKSKNILYQTYMVDPDDDNFLKVTKISSDDVFSADPEMDRGDLEINPLKSGFDVSTDRPDSGAYDYAKKRAALAAKNDYSINHYNDRHLNSLNTAWDVPHRAHGPQQPGYRGRNRRSRPSPDWDGEHVQMPPHARREEQSGLLDQFNAEYEAAHGSDIQYPALNTSSGYRCAIPALDKVMGNGYDEDGKLPNYFVLLTPY
jgi:hypothetical protein